MKKIILSSAFTIFLLLNIPSVLALKQIAGKLIVTVNIGSSNQTQWFLFNEENETITVKLRADGVAASYLQFPKKVELPPKIYYPITIVATIPSDYNTSFGGNLTGKLYALQEGTPGQVQINVQMRKSIEIIIPGLPHVELTAPTQTKSKAEEGETAAGSSRPGVGLLVLPTVPSIKSILIYFLIAVVAVFGGLGFYLFKKKRR
jgi:hypothetical protein